MGKKWKYVVIYVIYGIGFYLSQCGPTPSDGSQKWGTVEEDVMETPDGGIYQPFYGIINYELLLTEDTAKTLHIIRDELTGYLPYVDVEPFIEYHNDNRGYFYIAGVSEIDPNYHRIFGQTLEGEKDSVIAVASINLKFDDPNIGNQSVVVHEMRHQFGFHHHWPNIYCLMDSTIDPYNPPTEFCMAHRDSLKNLPTSGFLASINNPGNSPSDPSNNFSVKESLSLYADTIYEGQPMDFKVWIVNKSEKGIKVSAFTISIIELFRAWPVIILIKNEKGEIKRIDRDWVDYFSYPAYTIPPGDSVYYKFSRYVDLPPGKYWVKLEKGLLGRKGISSSWIPFSVKKSLDKDEKDTALPLLQSSFGIGINFHPLYRQILEQKAKEKNKPPYASDMVMIEVGKEFYEKIKRLNDNSVYLPYVLFFLMNYLILDRDNRISYEEFINSQYLKEFKKWKNFPYYEDIPLWEAMVLFRRAVRNHDISLYNLGMQKLEEAEKEMPRYLYIKLWKDFAQKVVKKLVEGGK